MPEISAVVSVPFGPLTVTASPSWRTSTPLGSSIGFFPIRDMERFSLPDLAEDFAADAALDGFVAGQDALGRRHDGQPEAAEDLRDLLLVAVDAAARAGDPLDAVDDRLARGRVLEVDPEGALRRLVGHRVVADESLGLEDPGDLHFEFRCGKLDAIVVGLDPVADPRQHIGYWVCHRHS